MTPIKIIIPTAGWATRMRPQTWSKPKPLVSVAGKTALDHLLSSFSSLPAEMPAEVVLILGPHLGETQIPPYMQEHHPELQTHYVVQKVMKGQADALWLAGEHLHGPVLVCFSDTLIETDFSIIARETADAIAWVKPVPDPRRFGVAELGAEGYVTRMVEKPQSLENNRVVVGCYYFREGSDLLTAIEEQFRQNRSFKGEYFLTETINIMIEHGLKMRTEEVTLWLDTGTIPATLETNRYLLEHGCGNAISQGEEALQIIPPVYIHPDAKVTRSTLGPHVSVGADCIIDNARIADSIIEAGAVIEAVALHGSFIGRQAHIHGRSADDPAITVNISDSSSVVMK